MGHIRLVYPGSTIPQFKIEGLGFRGTGLPGYLDEVAVHNTIQPYNFKKHATYATRYMLKLARCRLGDIKSSRET